MKILGAMMVLIGVSSTLAIAQTVVYDIEGNEYGSVKIGDHVWMTDNLGVTKYSDGTDIPYYANNSGDQTSWSNLTEGGRGAYYDSTNSVQFYGYLYNGYVAIDEKGVCPSGWRVPTDDEFKTLEILAGMTPSDADLTGGNRGDAQNVGGALRDTSTTGNPSWKSTASDNTDALGFSWDGSGWRFPAGAYQRTDGQRELGGLWTSTESGASVFHRRTVSFFNAEFPTNLGVTRVLRAAVSKNVGMAIRCITDETVQLDNSSGFRLLTAPIKTTYATLLNQIWTQGATGSDEPAADESNVWSWPTNATGTSSENWSQVTNLNDSLDIGTAVLVYVFDDNDADGSADAKARSLYVGGTVSTDDVSPTVNTNANGFTLMGNPFNKTIDFDNVAETDLTGTIYIWDPTSGGSGAWQSYETTGGTGDITDGLIEPFQGFFVQTTASPTAPDLTFSIDDTSASTGTFLGKTLADEKHGFIRLEVAGNGMGNSMWFHISESGAMNAGIYGDALKLESLNNDFIQLASLKNETLMDIAHLPTTADSYTIPLHIQSTQEGMFMLSATDFTISEDYELVFNDLRNNSSTLITPEFSYEISVTETVDKRKSKQQKLMGLTPLKVAAKNSSSDFSITVRKKNAVSNEISTEVPQALTLHQNYPNPFNPSTQITFEVPNQTKVRLAVYDLLGREVAILIDEVRPAGNYEVTFDASSLPSGMYVYRLSAGGQILTQQMTLIK
jgi:uncharacterized protein (TIGR02145 family)